MLDYVHGQVFCWKFLFHSPWILILYTRIAVSNNIIYFIHTPALLNYLNTSIFSVGLGQTLTKILIYWAYFSSLLWNLLLFCYLRNKGCNHFLAQWLFRKMNSSVFHNLNVKSCIYFTGVVFYDHIKSKLWFRILKSLKQIIIIFC